MTRTHRAASLLSLAAVLLALACDDDPAGPSPGDEKAEGELTFVRFDAEAFGRPFGAGLRAAGTGSGRRGRSISTTFSAVAVLPFRFA